MRDLQQLWDVVMSMPPPDVEEPESLYVLAASKTMLEKVEAAQREAGQSIGNDFDYGFNMALMETPIVDSPGKVLARHRIIRELSNIYMYRFPQN